MAVLEIVQYPNPVLATKAEDIKDFGAKTKKLIKDLFDTLYSEETGIGLAAPQIGVLKRVFVIDLSPERDSPLVFINPVLTLGVNKIVSEEGCLSIPGYREKIHRIETLSVTALDSNGKEFTLYADGLLARCIQHENDHLNGVLIIDHFSTLKKALFKKWLKKQK